jgi:hypothetical protein
VAHFHIGDEASRDAHELLAAMYDWFTKDFDTKEPLERSRCSPTSAKAKIQGYSLIFRPRFA